MKELKTYTVYCHVLKEDGRKYFGITKREPKDRWGYNGTQYKNSPYFYNSIKKYGWDSFEHNILHSNISKDEAKSFEIRYIKKYNTDDKKYGFNMTTGGDGVHSRNREIINKISEKESIPIVQLDMSGTFIKEYKSATEAQKELCIKSKNINSCCKNKYGRKTSYGYIWMYKDDYIKNGVIASNYNKNKCNKPIIQLDLKGNIIAKYESARVCEKNINISYKLISKVLNGDSKQTKGYIFIFDNEEATDKINSLKDKQITIINHNNQLLVQLDKNDNIINTFLTAREAEKYTNISYKNISRCVTGKSKTAGGYIWKYI